MINTYHMKKNAAMAVRAERFDGRSVPDIADVRRYNNLISTMLSGPNDGEASQTLSLDIATQMPDGTNRHATMTAQPHDWIVWNPNGDVFAVPSDLFDLLYELDSGAS